MKKTIMALCASLLVTACQQADTASEADANPVATAEGEAPPPPPMGDPSDNPDMTEFAAEVDANGDGEMSREEWDAKGLPDSSFMAFEKGRGFVTLADYQENAAPAGIDLDGDGKVTVAEFVAFDKQMADKMPPAPKP